MFTRIHRSEMWMGFLQWIIISFIFFQSSAWREKKKKKGLLYFVYTFRTKFCSQLHEYLLNQTEFYMWGKTNKQKPKATTKKQTTATNLFLMKCCCKPIPFRKKHCSGLYLQNLFGEPRCPTMSVLPLGGDIYNSPFFSSLFSFTSCLAV